MVKSRPGSKFKLAYRHLIGVTD